MERPAKRVRRRIQCGPAETPRWRSGPGTLCNACGVRLKAARVLREQVHEGVHDEVVVLLAVDPEPGGTTLGAPPARAQSRSPCADTISSTLTTSLRCRCPSWPCCPLRLA
ncbi:ras-associated and pleckstrin homology domains-containing protein 1-like isoform X2 [Panicum miliaceum]|uniref:Ras-associated and pleckstrin homology domains-containing protein 1-like isoform X2 n=1 Tax=Panicum miliaceum TaxID=4540 RepID=A0A3L6RSZ2_PANMI|nr:ras-associated and pleckstrin homology domains-containing protein 1-like isoform X2 [Panicum miliaceum]